MTQNEKVAIVTGGSRGIGQATVIALAEAGYHVVFSYAANKASAGETENTARVFGVKCRGIQADSGNPLESQSLIDQTMEEFGRIDVLVNNAGITKDGLLVRMSDDDWSRVMDVNLSGVFYTTRAASKFMMKQRSGHIINIASISGVYGNAGQANYSASKAGVIGFTKAVAKELGARNINVNVVAPGFIATDMTAGLPTDQVTEHVPLRRLGQPEDVAKVIVFLVTSGGYITGQVIQVDGGLTL
jgi:3-oxoacyl-[acyl-carrier protein] reductase